MQSLQITMNIDVDELQSFLMPNPEDKNRSVIIIYETTEGGAGILKALTETDTFRAIMKKARKILHEGEPADKACQKACYLCLCNYYNQRVHDSLDRNIVLPVLKVLSDTSVKAVLPTSTNAQYTNLLERCDSALERNILEKIRGKGIRLPDEAQYLIQSGRDIIAKPDFVYTKDGLPIAMFVDGPDHDKESVKKDDKTKRGILDLSGWNVFVIRYDEQIDEKVEELRKLIIPN